MQNRNPYVVLQGKRLYGNDFRDFEEPGLVEREDTPDERLILILRALQLVVFECGERYLLDH